MRRRLTHLIIPLLVFVLAGSASAKLVVHWRLDEGSGTTAFDSSGNGHDGTFVGTPQWVAGHSNAGALHFDGDAAASSVVHTLGSATSWPTGAIALWVKVDSVGQDNYSSVFTNHNPNTAGIQIDVDGGNPGNYRINPSGLIFGAVTTDWIHLAVTFDNTSATLYYNGNKTATGTLSATNTTFNRFAIGLNRNAANWIAATIDELSVYDHALSAVEVLSTMSGEPWPYAYNPTPADGAKQATTWVTLSWKPGALAVSHDVYLGDSFADVNAGVGDSFRGNQAAASLTVGLSGFAYPDGLVPGTTYYWRIDEVNNADPNSPWKGPVWRFSIPPKTAYDPSPADGAQFVATDVTLTWTPGFGAKLHHVYLGTNLADVEAGAASTDKGPVGLARLVPGKLESEKVYYWRVDEFDGASTHKGDIWAFTTPGAAGNPQPANGAADVQMTAKLSWTPATNAASHQIYFGTDKQALKNATTASPEYKGNRPLGSQNYDPGKLAWQTPYYWRVDAVYSANPPNPVKGLIWSFTTADFLLVDDFESYNNIDPPDPKSNRIFDKWIDGFGTTTNGAVVGNTLPPYAGSGPGRIHGGSQSMPYSYDNNLKTSEATMTLIWPRDWTEEGVTKLSLWFRGDAANAPERMYVALNGTAVVYHDNPSATQIATWTEWVIPLQTFAGQGVNLTNVTSITIGFGTRGNTTIASGTGKMYIDDIRLYRPATAP